MKIVEGSLRAHLGLKQGCACVLWEQDAVAGKIVDFAKGLNGKDVIGIFGGCHNPNAGLIGYKFTRGIVQDVTAQQQLVLQRNHSSLSLRNVCDMIPVEGFGAFGNLSGGVAQEYQFDIEPVGTGPTRRIITDAANPVIAYSTITHPESPEVHILTGARPYNLVKWDQFSHRASM